MVNFKLLIFCSSLLSIQTAFVLDGTNSSHAQFRNWNLENGSGIKFQFSTTKLDALLLYSDDKISSCSLEIKIFKGCIQLRFDYEEKSHLLFTSLCNYSNGKMHQVMILFQSNVLNLKTDQEESKISLKGPLAQV